MISTIEEKILDILFKDKLISVLVADMLLPEMKFNPEVREDLTPEMVVSLCRDSVKSNVQNLLREK